MELGLALDFRFNFGIFHFNFRDWKIRVPVLFVFRLNFSLQIYVINLILLIF